VPDKETDTQGEGWVETEGRGRRDGRRSPGTSWTICNPSNQKQQAWLLPAPSESTAPCHRDLRPPASKTASQYIPVASATQSVAPSLQQPRETEAGFNRERFPSTGVSFIDKSHKSFGYRDDSIIVGFRNKCYLT